MARPTKIEKKLSKNDVGSNGSHQAGILIPKKGDVLGFFPTLDSGMKNPRCTIQFTDMTGYEWTFNFVYYNNKLIESTGTRDEYRLTGMTAFIRANNLKENDIIIMSRSDDGQYQIRYNRNPDVNLDSFKDIKQDKKCITLSHSWKVIEF